MNSRPGSDVEPPQGFAGAVAAAMLADGIDPTDPAAIDAWMNEFNARPEHERAEVLTDDLFDGLTEGPPRLAPVVVPDEGEARVSAAQSRLLAESRVLVDFVGDGLKLTQTGRVNLADARLLVDLLDTGDRFDEKIGDRTFKTNSSADLPELSFIVRLGTKARFVRVVKGRLVSTKAGRGLGVDPLADFRRLIEAIDDVGMVSARIAGGRYIWTTLAPFFDDLFVPLCTLLLTSGPIEFEGIAELAFERFEERIDLDNPHWNPERRRDLVVSEMSVAMNTLEAVGASFWASETETSPYGTTKRVGGTVRLTAAGRWAMYHHLHEVYGIEFPVAEPVQFSRHSFEELLEACDTAAPDDFERLVREIDAWVEYRGDDAMGELTATVASTADAETRNMALGVLGDTFGAEAEPHVRGLLDTLAARGAALVWLVEHECEPADVLLDPDPAVFVDVLALTLISRGPADMTEVFEHTGGHETQLALLQQLWRQPNLATGFVLHTLGRHHPHTKVAKAARKAAHRHASQQRH